MKKVKIGGMYLVGLWKEHKGLMAFLFVGGMVLVLAAMAPGAWATPNQSPLRQTVPQGDVFACDPAGIEKNIFEVGDPVHAIVKNGTFTPDSQVDVYVVPDAAWAVDDPIPADVSGGVETVLVNANGAFGPPFPLIWPAPLTPGRYDAVFDANQNVKFDAGDGVDDAVLGTGFVVQAPPPVPVGGIIMPVSKVRVVAPWIGLAALMGVVVAAVVVRLRRQG